MKVRSGFVSNSSSSSFVVAVEKDAQEIVLTMKADLRKYADATATTVEELDRIIIDEHGWKMVNNLQDILGESPWLRRVYDEAKVAIGEGKHVIFGTVGNDYDDSVANLIYEDGIPESPGIEILSNSR